MGVMDGKFERDKLAAGAMWVRSTAVVAAGLFLQMETTDAFL